MNDEQRMLADMASAIFATYGEAGASMADWAEIETSGMATLLVPEASGGFGGTWGDAAILFRLVGYHAVALPIVEATIAAGVVADVETLTGFGTIAARSTGARQGDRFTGTLPAVPWGRDAGHVVVQDADGCFALHVADAAVDRGDNPGGEPRDTLRFEAVAVHALPTPSHPLFDQMALARAMTMAGAVDAALALSVSYANERMQFGKPLAKFQAVQQSLASFATQAAAANSAAAGAAAAIDRGDAGFTIGAAKLRANMAAGIGTDIAHQVHGAIGFTREFALQRFTRRLWSWRSEFGGDAHWAAHIGSEVAARGSDGFWSDLVAR